MTPSGTWLRMASTIAAFCIASTLVIAPAQPALAVTPEDEAAVQAAAGALAVTNIGDVRGNLTLPTTGPQETTIAWASEDSAVVDPSGIVHRPATGQPTDQVTLTALITKNDAVTTKAFTAVVPALPETPKFEAYMFPYFTGDSIAGEKIYFGASNGNDARNWLTLNGGQPVKASTMGTKGLRDPFIVRSPEGDKFYMIATDLSIGSGTTWDASQRQGSQYMEIWESTDLVNWSEQRHVKVSPDNAGNTWAPEAYYDPTLGEYVVFWASKLYNTADHSEGQPNQMLYATTRDFVTFTPAKVWQNTGKSRIDSTVIGENGVYHRFTKDEAQSTGCLDIMQEHSTSLTAVTTVTSATSDTWKLDATCIGKGAGTAAVEGPTVFKANDGDVNGPGYYLFVDEFGGRKYIPLFSKTLQNASWSVPTGYSLPSPAPRHGTIMPITAAEQRALMGAYLPAANAVAPVKISTVVGTPAALPRTATVTFADNSTRDLAVSWNAPAPADYYTREGTVTVTGAVTGTDLTATATVSVIPAGSDTLLHYDFSKTTGTVVPDSSPWGRDGAIKGTGATVAGDVLTLPGGAAGSSAGYVQLPTGTFDGQNTLTVSAWLKNETASGNYAAMFFGGPNNPPSQYWLLNPRNSQGRFKSVITNGNSTSAPWGTEAGISPTNSAQGIAGPLTDNSWGLYTTVIEPNQITGYYNGTKIGTVATTRKVSDFGTSLVSYIGRSSYPDPFYKGGVKDVLVHSTAKTADQIKDYYFKTVDPAVVDAALQADANAINLGATQVTGNLTLPTSGAKGSAISWASSNPAVISTTGEVNRPSGADVPVTLTATLTLGNSTITRQYQLTVVAQNAQAVAPAAPAAPSLTADGSSLTASWVTPGDGGSAITGYTVTLYTSAGAVHRTAQADASATSHRFADLPAGSYQAAVVATNAVGDSAASPKSSPAVVGTQLLARYDFSSVVGTSVADASGNGKTATIVGSGATISGKELTLPGGSAGSAAAHVKLPTGMFDGQNTLSISAWLKNETGSGNYAAMFFGSAASPPAQYWLLNPRNQQGLFKSVITDGNEPSAPWGTEAGISPTTASKGIPGPATGTEWGLYTTVIKPGSITGYYNGTKIGTVPTTRTVTDFGTNLVAYVGRSTYPDNFYKGGVRDVSVFSTALSDADVANAYYTGAGDPAVAKAALDADAAALNLGPATVNADLTLPPAGAKGSRITWASSDPAHLDGTGKVTRPATDDVTVTLTATLELAGQTTTRSFTFTVLANTPQKDLLLVADTFNPAFPVVAEDVTLAAAVGNVTVSWQSSDPAVLSTAGKVSRPAAETTLTLTATFAANGLTEVRTYTVKVLAADGGRIGSYIQSGNTDRTDALHLASSQGTGSEIAGNYAGLNNGRPVLYPTIGAVKFGSPVVFRKADGSFGLVATVDSNSSSIYVYDSADLVTFTGERLVAFNSRNLAAASVAVKYDNSIAAYRLTFVSKTDGKTYQVSTKDFAAFTDPVEVPAVPVVAQGTFPAGALEPSSIGVTKAEYDRVFAKYSRPFNTGVAPFSDVTPDGGGQLTLPTTSEVRYNNGSTTTMGVQWNAADMAAVESAVESGKAGTYTVNGTVQRPTYPEKLVAQRADPDVIRGDDGYYYFTASYPMVGSGDPDGYDRVTLRRATTIAGLGTAPEVTIWDENTSALNRYVWAPELHKVGDSWYMFFTASVDGSVWSIRPVVLKLDGTDLMDRSKWRELGRMKPAAGDTEAFRGFSLDMTYFENAGKHYVVWAEKPGASTLRMATIDPADPSQLTSKSILLSTPTMAWEKNAGQSVDEGPAVIKKDGKVFITFSAATVDAAYCVGLLSAAEGSDLMNPSVWTKNPYPILQTADVPGQAGPGHNSFTVDEYGNPVIVFHSRTIGEVSGPGDQGDGGLFDPGRHARAATVHFAADGQPILNMAPAEELADQFKNVQVKVVVPDSAAPVLTAGLNPADPTGSNGWYTGDVALVASATDDSAVTIEYRVDGGAWLPYSAAVGFGEGSSTVEVRATDAAGHQSAVTTLDVRRDVTPPQVSAAFDDQGGTSLGPVVVTLSGSDAAGGSGLAAIEYSLDGGPWTTYTALFPVSGAGSHALAYRATDGAGNASADKTATVTIAAPDTTAPVLTVAVAPDAPDGSNGWWKSTVSVTASASDDSGVAPLIEASRDGGLTWDVFAPVQLNDSSPALKVRAVDAAGNMSAVVDREIRIDTVVPSASAVVDSAARTVAVNGADADPGSGVAGLEYRVNNAEPWTSSAGASTTVTVGDGAATVEYRAVDTAGNVSPAQSALVPAKAAPKAAVTLTSSGQPSAEGWYAKDVSVAITAPSGTAAEYRLDGGAWQAAAQPFTISASGPHTVDHRLLTGSVVIGGSAGSVAVKIDKIVPTTAAVTSPASGTGTPRNPVTVMFSAQDSLSGVARIEYRLNLGAWTTIAAGSPLTIATRGDYVVSYRSFDEAGNADRIRTTSVKITPDVAPSLKASAGTVKPGGSLTFTVAGFDRWDQVVLSAGATNLGTVFTDVKGTGKVTLQIPVTTPLGSLTIKATGSDGEPVATVSVTVKR
ncbi:family 43 glycosylhydrolase [Arthrobacter sp. CDRTa11]|uniref:immunoglobulin-like domain-containing protein n=1 Tax=Arthrobacter sp. CDRTa11 TaxID=2651199 RepID=UPI002265E6E1|nr:immunoglobulin-like domain-containing protein [Arthrobacter sp. CDRTa11]UZX02082.1 family 43 glycosylhydrolase [Arthrobacter sp. CDRTa11]